MKKINVINIILALLLIGSITVSVIILNNYEAVDYKYKEMIVRHEELNKEFDGINSLYKEVDNEYRVVKNEYEEC